MATLIGDSGHGRDIRAALGRPPGEDIVWVSHHSEGFIPGSSVIIGINDPWLRAQVAAELGVEDLAWVHPRAYLGPDTIYGYGTHINYNAAMTRTTLGHHVTIAPGVLIGGDVTIGDRVLVGMGAIIGVPRAGTSITIGNDVTIGAGAVVLHDIDAGTWVGNPARRIK